MKYSDAKPWIPITSRFRKPWRSIQFQMQKVFTVKVLFLVGKMFRDCLLTYDAKGAPDEPEAAGHALISGAASRRPQPGNGYQYIRLISQEKKLVRDNVRTCYALKQMGCIVQSGATKCNPEMGETAIQPEPAQTADLSISGLLLVAQPCIENREYD